MERERKYLHGVDASIPIDCCTACGSLVGKDDEDWERHLNWHRLLRNLTAPDPDGRV